MPDLIEAADSVAPGSADFSATGSTPSSAVATFYCERDDLEEKAREILGTVEPLGDGRLARGLPRVHPQFTWMSATDIKARGVGMKAEGISAREYLTIAPDHVPAVIEEYLAYASYDLEVSFVGQPFTLFADDEVDVLPGVWFDDDGIQRTFAYADEWKRFTDWPETPASEFVEFKQGAMRFRTEEGATTGVDPDGPHGAAFGGTPRIPMPKRLLKCMWYRVPVRYLKSRQSYLHRFLWRVNQNAVIWDDEQYEPGELLYVGASVPRRNPPPFPTGDVFNPGVDAFKKIIDIELTFSVCRFEDPEAAIPQNSNWIANGHNLFPWAGDREMHYPTAEFPDDTENELGWVPTFLSAPFELMFTDPNLVQPNFGSLR